METAAPPVHVGAAVAIFGATYVLVSAGRLRWIPLGRPVAALAGAVLMVLVAGLPRDEAYRSIDHDTLALLLGMLGITAYLARAGFFEAAEGFLLRRFPTPRALLAGTGALAGILSAFLVNDAVCLFLTPVVVLLCRRLRLPFAPYLMAVATCANIGSVATLVGNPQCMILGNLGGLGFRDYAARMAPVAAVALAANVALLLLFYGRSLGPARRLEAPPPETDRPGLRRAIAVVALVLAGFFGGLPLGWCGLGGFVLLALLSREDPAPVLRRIDWSVLLFFAGLFVVVRGFALTGIADRAWEGLPEPGLDSLGGRAVLSAALAVGSNVVSNVPIVLVVAPKLAALDAAGGGAGWHLAAMATTFAGNLTLLGSVANIIVAEGAKEDFDLGFLEYLKFGVLSTALSLAVGVVML
jgi:Na+/H+ antiporter NhaD/arsenite permease-like protein